MMQTEDKQISLTDPDARSMATSGRGSGMVGYNVQSAVDTKHVGTEMALHVLAYNMKRVISILGVGGLMEAIRA